MKRRNRSKRYTNPRILIICEGETEAYYFKGIMQDADYKTNLASVRVSVFAGRDSGPLKLVEEAIKRGRAAKKEGNPF